MLKFGTSGLRALVTEMTDRECYINARGFLAAMQRCGEVKTGSRVSLAGDLRSSTGRILQACAAAIRDVGLETDYCGRVPSPALALHGFSRRQASIMVTGSHIPDDRNGIKFNKPTSEVLKSDEPGVLQAVAGIRAMVDNWTPAESLFDAQEAFKPGQAAMLPAVDPSAEEAYVGRYLNVFPAGLLAGRKIVLEEHSAVGRDILGRVLEALGAEVIREGRTDHFIPKDTENVTAETRDTFLQFARQHQPFAIVSTDGDSDRPFVVDEDGVFIRGDELGAIVARFLKAGAAALPVSANDAVVRFLADNGIPLTQTRIGSPYVIAAMDQAAAEGRKPVVGWEVNGGFLTATEFTLFGKTLQPLPTRDALLPILCSLSAGVTAGGMRRLFSQLPQRFTQAGLLDNFPVAVSATMVRELTPAAGAQRITYDADAAECVLEDGRTVRFAKTEPAFAAEDFWKHEHDPWAVKHALEQGYFTAGLGYGKVIGLNLIDGVRVFFSNGDVAHIRPSGNAPQLRIYSNAATQERADQIVAQGLDDQGVLRKMEKHIQAR